MSAPHPFQVLVIGQGGREHAMVRALKFSPSLGAGLKPASHSGSLIGRPTPSQNAHYQINHHVHALPGSAGMATDCVCHDDLNWEKFDQVLELVLRQEISLVVIGPELPLAAGLSDFLRDAGVQVFAPSQAAARLESSKIFAKEFMIEAKVPTARSFTVSTVEQTASVCGAFAPPYVLKADGLAAGKGVFICKTVEELLSAARSIFDDHSLGEAGKSALLEEFSPGFEISYLVITNGEKFESLVLAQDHKRLLNGDEGPNTGGMGVVAPMHLEPELKERVDREVIQPVISHLKTRGLLYRGVLYFGLMMTPEGPSVLEFNTRFGDPETQVILPLLDGDWAEVFSAVARGEVPKLKWKKGASACVVLAAEGYPEDPKKGVSIAGDLGAAQANEKSYFLHAGTSHDANRGWLTAGGRVLNSVGLGQDLHEALSNAYARAERAVWPGRQMRTDIGANAQSQN